MSGIREGFLYLTNLPSPSSACSYSLSPNAGPCSLSVQTPTPLWSFQPTSNLLSSYVPSQEWRRSWQRGHREFPNAFYLCWFFGAPSGYVGSQPEWILLKLIIIQYLIYLLHVCYQIFLASRIETASKICFNTESADVHLIQRSIDLFSGHFPEDGENSKSMFLNWLEHYSDHMVILFFKFHNLPSAF